MLRYGQTLDNAFVINEEPIGVLADSSRRYQNALAQFDRWLRGQNILIPALRRLRKHIRRIERRGRISVKNIDDEEELWEQFRILLSSDEQVMQGSRTAFAQLDAFRQQWLGDATQGLDPDSVSYRLYEAMRELHNYVINHTEVNGSRETRIDTLTLLNHLNKYDVGNILIDGDERSKRITFALDALENVNKDVTSENSQDVAYAQLWEAYTAALSDMYEHTERPLFNAQYRVQIANEMYDILKSRQVVSFEKTPYDEPGYIDQTMGNIQTTLDILDAYYADPGSLMWWANRSERAMLLIFYYLLESLKDESWWL